jgi:PIN domain nuclease of toxin-antitoxin system
VVACRASAPHAPRACTLGNARHEGLVSVASLWETAVKASLKRITADPLGLYEAAIDSGFEIVSIQPMHAIAVNSLPLHHGDPFDRMLVAQARAERLTLLTHDKTLLAYGGDIEVV